MAEILMSEVYLVDANQVLVAQPQEGHYEEWGYAIAELRDSSDQPIPPDGNTVIFCILPKRMTEPVFVTKPDLNAAFYAVS